MKKSHLYFKVGELYSIDITSQASGSEYTVLVQQEYSSLTLSDGVPMLLTYGDQNDLNKFMFFSIPEGLHTININVRALTEGFHPHLYVNY
jgi:hypothetical protein